MYTTSNFGILNYFSPSLTRDPVRLQTSKSSWVERFFWLFFGDATTLLLVPHTTDLRSPLPQHSLSRVIIVCDGSPSLSFWLSTGNLVTKPPLTTGTVNQTYLNVLGLTLPKLPLTRFFFTSVTHICWEGSSKRWFRCSFYPLPAHTLLLSQNNSIYNGLHICDNS